VVAVSRWLRHPPLSRYFTSKLLTSSIRFFLSQPTSTKTRRQSSIHILASGYLHGEMYPKIKYGRVPNDLSDDSDEPTPRFLRAPGRRPYTLIFVLICSLVTSNALTWFCTAKLWRSIDVQRATDAWEVVHIEDGFGLPTSRSTYGMLVPITGGHIMLNSVLAGLVYDTAALLESHTPYTDHNDTLRDQMWLDMDLDAGMVALDDDDTARWGLPEGQRFPWDDSKSIYLLQAHHSLHCAVSAATFSHRIAR
jgi:hypothetical protein